MLVYSGPRLKRRRFAGRFHFSQHPLSKYKRRSIVLTDSWLGGGSFALRGNLTPQSDMSIPQIDHVRPIDQTVLEVLHQGLRSSDTGGGCDAQGMSVRELTRRLEVTPTAVRQRLERLIQFELIERRKQSNGRGRPQYRYFLTVLGKRYAAASYADLASALWLELLDLPNSRQRSNLLKRVAKRMGEGLKGALPECGSVEERMSAAVVALGRRRVQASVNEKGDLPVLEVHSCPYPELTEDAPGRQLCEMEQEMLSTAIGQSLHLDCCRLDGHELCQFRPVGGVEAEKASSS